VADLEELPDHHHLQHRADAAGGHEKRIRDQHELVEPREEGPMFESHADERVDVLLEGQIDTYPDRSHAFR